MYSFSNIYDYYVMLSMYVEADNNIRASGWPTRQQDKFLDRLSRNMGDLEHGLAETVVNYLTLACAGEARHAYRECSAYLDDIELGMSRSDVARHVVHLDPTRLLEELSILYNQYKWSSNFGGKSWGHISDFALQYRQRKISAQFFIDHIVDLVHNGGFAFDKRAALEMADLNPNVGQGSLLDFLTLKSFSVNLLDAEELEYIAPGCTTTTRSLVGTFYRVFRGCEAPDFWRYATEDWPTLNEIKWGDQEVSEVSVNYTHVTKCPLCGCYVHNNSTVSVNDQEVCYECYKTNYWSCTACGHKHMHSEAYTRFNDDKWCDRCVSRYLVTCAHCGEVTNKYSTKKTDDGKVLCHACYVTEVIHLDAAAIEELGSCMTCSSLIDCKLKKYMPGYVAPETVEVEEVDDDLVDATNYSLEDAEEEDEVDNGPVLPFWKWSDTEIPF